MKILLLTAALVFGSLSLQAEKMAFHGGLSLASGEYSAVSYSSETGFQAGVLYYQPMSGDMMFRTGAAITQRKMSFTSGGKVNVDYMHLDVPATVQMNTSEKFGVFGGLNFALKMSDSCSVTGSTCQINDPESLYYGLQLGVHIAFSQDNAMEVVYEKGLNDMARTLEVNRIGLNFVMMM